MSDRFPSAEDAYEEARHGLRKSWSHTLVYLAGRAVGFGRLQDQSGLCGEFRVVYVSLCRRAAAGEDFGNPCFVSGLGGHRAVVSTRGDASAASALRDMRQSLGGE